MSRIRSSMLRLHCLSRLVILISAAVLVLRADGQATITITADRAPTFDELRESQFVVAFSKQVAPEGVRGRLISMQDMNGSRYSCYVPVSSSEAEAEDASDQAEAGSLVSEKTPEELLDALTDWCTYRMEDWWQYEVCYKKHVRQFHKDGSKVTAEYRLGNYSAEQSDTNDVQVDSSSISTGAKYVSQQYVGGEPCELTGQPRSAEVRYVCSPEGDSVISSLLEPRSCHYRITIRTPRLCKHPAFRQQPRPVSIIKCYPLQPLPEVAAAADGGAAEDTAATAGEAAAGAGECAADGGIGDGTCGAGGEGSHRRHVVLEKITASSLPSEEGSESVAPAGAEEEVEEVEKPERLLKSLLDRQNGFEEDDNYDEYDD